MIADFANHLVGGLPPAGWTHRRVARWLFDYSAGLRLRKIPVTRTVDGVSLITDYMERYLLKRTERHNFFLHRFVGPDGDRAPHNHPFDSSSIILAGGYEELRVTDVCPVRGPLGKLLQHNAPGFNRVHGTTVHQIIRVRPETWTLFITGPKYKLWGHYYTTPDGVLFKGDKEQSGEGDDWDRYPLARDADRIPFML